MAAGERLNPAKCNIVQQEQIWKDYVYHEGKAVKGWAATWGFLRKEYQNITVDIESARNKRCTKEQEPLKLPSIHCNNIKVSKIPFVPITTSQDIGWRSARREYNLERFGNWSRPKRSILNHFKWPIDACP